MEATMTPTTLEPPNNSIFKDNDVWGWILYLYNGTTKILSPGSKPRIRDLFDANVALRWQWNREEMWVAKNRWGNAHCWLSPEVNLRPLSTEW